MHALIRCSLWTFVSLCSFARPLQAQDNSSYRMDLLRAAWVGPEGKAYITLLFGITPKQPDFKLVLSMKFTYDVGNGEQILDEHSKQISMAGYDVKTVFTKDPKVYRFIQDKVDFNNQQDMMLLRIDLRHIAPESLEHLRVKYGLWEGSDDSVRHERWFDAPLENLTHPVGAFDQ